MHVPQKCCTINQFIITGACTWAYSQTDFILSVCYDFFLGFILDDILYFCYITSYYDCNWWKLYIFYMYLSINTAWSILSWVVILLVIFLIQLTNDLIIFYWWHRTYFYWLKSVGDLCINQIIWFLLHCSKCKIVLNWNSLKQKWMSFKFIQH